MKSSKKTPIKTNVWFWEIGIVIFLAIIGIVSGIKKPNDESSSNSGSNIASEKTETQSANSADLSYKIFKTDDLSMKALGNKLLSQYSISEIKDLPMDKRFSYDVLVARNISEENLRKVAEKVVSDTRLKDNDIDELTLNFFDDEKEKTPSGKAIWAPNGEWGSVTPEIAKSNNRSSYKVELSYYEFSNSDDSNKMTEKEREIYNYYYDSITRYQKENGMDADVTVGSAFDKQIISEITKKYSITEDEFEKILYKDR